MTVSHYRLTTTGWVGAALFVLPTPIGAIFAQGILSMSAEEMRYREALSGLSLHALLMGTMVCLATATMVGLVMIVVGRETVTS